MAGTVVEWYEFFLYGTAATLVFGKVFFDQGASDLENILKAFVTYAVGFIARPLGGIVFGHIGDQIRPKEAAAVQPGAGRPVDLPDGLLAHLRADRVPRTHAARAAAVPAGLRGRR